MRTRSTSSFWGGFRPSLYPLILCIPLLATMSSKLRELLATMRFFATKSKIFGPSKKYNAVNSESDDDEGQSKLLSCPHCENTTRVTRTRSGQQLSLTYSGWVFSAIVMGLLIWLVWLGDVNLKQKCFRATSSYCKFRINAWSQTLLGNMDSDLRISSPDQPSTQRSDRDHTQWLDPLAFGLSWAPKSECRQSVGSDLDV